MCDAENFDRLKEYHITHILNATPDLPCYWKNHYQYLRIDVLDLPSQNIRQYFDQAIDFIGQFVVDRLLSPSHRCVFHFFLEQALHCKENNVLVHCSAGISRSPTLVLAYMIKNYRMTLDQAFEKMRQLRRIVDPNVSFMLQLRDWEKLLLASNESNDEHACPSTAASAGTRSNSSAIYCGSSSKSKNDTKTRSDSSAIPVS